ncbi:MAG: acyltransferase [Rhodoglobus sp.]
MTDGISEHVSARSGAGQLKAIQVARGLAALAVVAFHSGSIEEKYFHGVTIMPSIFSEGMAGVDLFFVISGFVMVLTTRNSHVRPAAVGKFAWNRFFRIYPTYWFYFLLLVPVLFLLPGFINAAQGGHVDLFTSFFLLPSDTLPILIVGWTLTLELWFYVVFIVVLFLPRRWLIPALAVWFVLLVIVNWNGPIDSTPFVEVPANSLAIEFIFGGVAALLFRRIPTALTPVLAAAGIAVLIFLGTPTPSSITAGPGLARPLTIGLGFALLLLAATAFENRRSIGPFARLTILGDMSYSVYLSHVLVLSVTGRIWAAFAGPFSTNIVAVVAYWVLTFTAVLVFGYLSYRFVERPVMRLSVRWRGRVFRSTPRPVVATSTDASSAETPERS